MMSIDRRPGSGGLASTFKAVFWSFFGVRRKSDHDAARLRPAQVIVAGLVCALLFVVALVVVVRIVVASTS